MSTLTGAAVTALGVAVVAAAVRDIFHSLFHPGGHGRLGLLIMRATWRVGRRASRGRPNLLALAGPVALVTVLLSWAVLLAIGWALVIWPSMPDAFVFASGIASGDRAGLTDAIYVSSVTLTTLGFGDITPADGWLRVLLPVEALIGFALLTASISWVLALFPPLTRRRALAYELFLMRATDGARVGARLDREHALALYGELTSRLATIQQDLVTFPISYYFRETDERFVLAGQLGYLVRLAEEGESAGGDPALRWRATMLHRAADDLAGVIAQRFGAGPPSTTTAVFDAYARDQCVAGLPAGGPRSTD